jgi:hypothetical protein
MKTRFLLTLLLTFAIALIVLGQAYAQTPQPGDFIVSGSDWYRADGTYVKSLSCGYQFCDWGGFDAQGYFYRVGQINNNGFYLTVDKYDSSLNYLGNVLRSEEHTSELQSPL